MGWWSTVKNFLIGTASAITGYAAEAVIAGSLAVISWGFLAAVVVVVVITLIVVLVDYYVFPDSPEVPEEDFYNYAVTGDFQYHASIHLNNVHHCSGAYIGASFILTVAQCVYTYVNDRIEKSKLKVYVGTREVPAHYGYGYAVDKIIVHPNFNAHRLAYNIAVLKLEKEVTEPYWAKPIALPSARMRMEKTTVLVGGFRNLNAPTVLTNMTKSEMTIIEYKICRSHFITQIETGLKFCVIPSYCWKPCQTSRGGTAANKDEILIGLYVMANPQGCAKNLPEIFVSVAGFLDFIRDATK